MKFIKEYIFLAFFCTILNIAFTSSAFAGWVLKEDESLFAVFTRKIGIAQAFAHNHLVVATKMKVENLKVGDPLSQSTLKLVDHVNKLELDEKKKKKKWKPLLEKLNIVNADVKLGDLSEEDRKKIKEEIEDEGQLDLKKFTEITFALKGVESGKLEQIKALANIHGVEQELTFNVTYDQKDKKAIIVTGVAKSKFKDFGVKPFSMIVVGNENEFDFVMKAVLRYE